MSWSVSEAKARLSEVLARARRGPQIIENRGEPVAVVLSKQEYDRLQQLHECGLARLPKGEKQERLTKWLEGVLASSAIEVIPVDAAVSRAAGRLERLAEARGQPRPLADLILAATAQVTGSVVATPNTADFEGLGVPLLDPFVG